MRRLSLLFFLLHHTVVQAKSIEECTYAIKCGSYEEAKKALDDPTSDLSQKNTNGLTPLLSAAYEGRGDIVLYLFLSKGADLKATDLQNRNLFHLASLKGKFGVIQPIGNSLKTANKTLLEKLLKAQDDLGMTPFHLAAQYGQQDILGYILALGMLDPNMLDGNGKSPLYWALKNKQNAAAQTLISFRGFNINNQSPWGMSALHEAARGGHSEVVKSLVEKGADLNIKDVDGRTPLYWASERGHPEVVAFLIDKGADPTITDEDKRTILQRAARYGHTAVVKILLQKTKLDINGEDSLGNSALSWAVLNDHKETVQALLDAKADIKPLYKIFATIAQKGNTAILNLLVKYGFDLNHKDEGGKIALDMAASVGTAGVTNLILSQKKSSDPATIKNALISASKASNAQTMETLLNTHNDNREALRSLLSEKSIDLYGKDADGKSVSSYALAKRHIKLLTLLLLLGDSKKILGSLKAEKANLDTLDQKDGMAMLHYAALMGDASLVQAILEAGASIDRPQKDKNTALHNAVSSKNLATIETLLKAKASFVVQNKRGETPFTKAINSGFGDGVEIFLKYGADPTTFVGNVRPQEEAIKSGNAEMVELFMDHVKGDMKALDDFHKKEVLQDMKDDQGMTLMHWIAKKGHSGLLDVALRLAVRPLMSGVDKTGRTPLHYAAAGGFDDIIKKLYAQEDSGLDLNTQNNDRQTPMHEAAIHKHPDTVKALLKLKADQTLKDSKGKTALEYLPDGGKKILDELNPPKPKDTSTAKKK